MNGHMGAWRLALPLIVLLSCHVVLSNARCAIIFSAHRLANMVSKTLYSTLIVERKRPAVGCVEQYASKDSNDENIDDNHALSPFSYAACLLDETMHILITCRRSVDCPAPDGRPAAAAWHGVARLQPYHRVKAISLASGILAARKR